jgi:Xaa-Pro aminopeptidase
VIELQRAVAPEETVNGFTLLNRLRRIKSPAELELMTAACRIAEEAMMATTPFVRPGVTMVDLLEEVEHQMRARLALPIIPNARLLFRSRGRARLWQGER